MADEEPSRAEPGMAHPEGEAADIGRVLEEIDESECLELLRTQDLGRLAIVRDGRPEIFPVNYALVDHMIVIRTQPGLKLTFASLAHVAFEVEEIDRETREGWTVEVRGLAEDITDSISPWAEAGRRAAVRPWVRGPHGHYISITRSEVSGRRIRRPTGT